jgi:membrane peptidoglycan carboxypeptidase
MGKMDVSAALNYSRNIPAIKMFYLAGGENEIVEWMEKIGAKSMQSFKDQYFEDYGREYSYGAAMSLGTALMTPLELAESYSVYANMGYKKELVPVIKILDSKGLIIEEFKKENNLGEEVIDPSTAFITNHILSDTSSRPEFWNKYLSLSGRKVAAKTGTSTKQYESG